MILSRSKVLSRSSIKLGAHLPQTQQLSDLPTPCLTISLSAASPQDDSPADSNQQISAHSVNSRPSFCNHTNSWKHSPLPPSNSNQSSVYANESGVQTSPPITLKITSVWKAEQFLKNIWNFKMVQEEKDLWSDGLSFLINDQELVLCDRHLTIRDIEQIPILFGSILSSNFKKSFMVAMHYFLSCSKNVFLQCA